jgi:hypothetical protein
MVPKRFVSLFIPLLGDDMYEFKPIAHYFVVEVMTRLDKSEIQVQGILLFTICGLVNFLILE